MSRFSVEYFRLTVPNVFVEEPLSAVFQKSSASEKVYGKEGRARVPNFHVTIFCLSVPKDFVGGKGEYQDFPSKIFCITPESFHRRIL